MIIRPSNQSPSAWNLWLDDMRDPEMFLSHRIREYRNGEFVYTYREMTFPEFEIYVSHNWRLEDFEWCKTARSAIACTKRLGPPSFMALDHDLGDHDVFVYLKWLSETYTQYPPEWHAHSANPTGVKNINSFMESWHKAWGNRVAL